MLGAFTILACLSALIGYSVKKWNDGAEGRRRRTMNELILSNGGYWGHTAEYGGGNFLSLDSGATKTQLDTILKELSTFDDQVEMNFTDSQFDDEHAHQIAGHRRLANLWLSNTLVTDNGLKEIVVLHELKNVVLDKTAVTDEGLKYLVRLSELQYLSLDNTAITDAGLEHLAKLPKLEDLHVRSTKATAEGIAKLKRALPALHVNVYYGM